MTLHSLGLLTAGYLAERRAVAAVLPQPEPPADRAQRLLHRSLVAVETAHARDTAARAADERERARR